MLRHLSRLRDDERGTALVTAMLCTLAMLGFGMALLSIVDSQASQSVSERTRDKGFNLAESVLNSEAFVLGRNWPTSAAAAQNGGAACSASASGFGAIVGAAAAATPVAAVERLRPNLNASYTDSDYENASWQVNVCDDFDTVTVWSDTVLNNVGYDANNNNKLWVRAQSIVGGRTRALVGLVDVRELPPLKSKYGLVAGNVSEDVSSTVSAGLNASVLSGINSALLGAAPPVAEDASGSYPAPLSGVTGLRCGLLENVLQVKTCITGAIGALSQVPAINTLVTGGKYDQFPTTQSMSAPAIAQLRAQAKTSPGVYMATAPGATSASSAPSCAITGATTSSVVFIEQVGTGDQYCYVDVSTSVQYKALVIGSGRVIIRGNNSVTDYTTTTANRFTGVVYALNQQTSDLSATTPIRELVRIEKGARVRGAVHADGKNATVAMVPPDFDMASVVTAVLCPGVLCTLAPTLNGLLGTLGVSGTVNALVNGTCLVSLPLLGCTVSLPGQGITGITKIVNNVTSQLTAYGSAIHSDVAVVKLLKVYGASGVSPGTFRDLNAK
jgi:Tfp pilus assembly protein PilX